MTPDRIIVMAGHRFNLGNVCEVCGMARYLWESTRRPKCGTPEAAAVLKRHAAAMGRMSA